MMISLGSMVVSGTGDKIAAVSDKPQHDNMMFEEFGNKFVNMPV